MTACVLSRQRHPTVVCHSGNGGGEHSRKQLRLNACHERSCDTVTGWWNGFPSGGASTEGANDAKTTSLHVSRLVPTHNRNGDTIEGEEVAGNA